MPLIILIINLGLHTSEEYDDSSEAFLHLGSVESLPALLDFIEQLLPLLDVIA